LQVTDQRPAIGPGSFCHAKCLSPALATLARATTIEKSIDSLAVWLEMSLVPRFLFISLLLVLVSARYFGKQKLCLEKTADVERAHDTDRFGAQYQQRALHHAVNGNTKLTHAEETFRPVTGAIMRLASSSPSN
jgi:hypothetical protein